MHASQGRIKFQCLLGIEKTMDEPYLMQYKHLVLKNMFISVMYKIQIIIFLGQGEIILYYTLNPSSFVS